MILVEQLCVQCNQRTILGPLDVSFPKNSLSVILGPNGAGKTTLLRALAGFSSKEAASIRYHLYGDGVFSSAPVMQQKGQIGWLAQEQEVGFEFSVRDFVALGRFAHHHGHVQKKDWDIVSEVLEAFDVKDKAEQSVFELSTGERQRIHLARVFAAQTPVVILDEPTSHLDPKYSYAVLDHLAKICKSGRATIVLSMHDLQLAKRFAGYVLMLKHGKKIIAGPTAEALKPEHLYATFEFDFERTAPAPWASV